MSSLLSDLRRSRTDYPVLLRDFLIKKSRNSKHLVCFFEGEDAKYYISRIDSIIPRSKFEQIHCGGKDKVLRLYKTIMSMPEHKNAWLAFFIDRDFEKTGIYTSYKKLYVTPVYSIENFYLSEECFKKILINEFDMHHSDDLNALNNICDKYISRLKELGKGLSLFMAWYKLSVDNYKKNSSPENKIRINNFKMGNIVSVEFDKVTVKRYSQNTFRAKSCSAKRFSNRELGKEKKRFEKKRPEKEYRGKTIISLLRTLLKKLIEDANSNTPKYFPCKRKVRLQVSNANILSELSSYADVPECLINFLSDRKKEKPIK